MKANWPVSFLVQNFAIVYISIHANTWIYVAIHGNTWQYTVTHIVYVIESAAYGVVFTSCLCENPNERSTCNIVTVA